MKKNELISAAKELNKVLGLDPQIETKAKPALLSQMIQEAAKLIDPELDELTDATQAVCAKLTKHSKMEDASEPEKEEVEKEEVEKEEVEKEEVENTNKESSNSPIKKVGIISTIVEVIEKSGEKGVTKKEILEILVKKFPDKLKEGMGKTINVQVPNRISKEKFKLECLENGSYRKA